MMYLKVMGKGMQFVAGIVIMFTMSGCLLLYRPSGSRPVGKTSNGPVVETKYEDSYGNEVTVRDDGVVNQMKSKDPLGNDFTATTDTSGALTTIGLTPYPNTEIVEYVTKTEIWENRVSITTKVHQFTRDNPATVMQHYTAQFHQVESKRMDTTVQTAHGVYRNMPLSINIAPYHGKETLPGGYMISLYFVQYK